MKFNDMMQYNLIQYDLVMYVEKETIWIDVNPRG